MQTHVRAPAEASKQQNQSTQKPAQLLAESQTVFEDARAETTQLNAMQSMMGASQQNQNMQALQARMNNSTQTQNMQSLQMRMVAGALAQRRVAPAVESATIQRVEEEPLTAKLEGETAQREATAVAPPEPTAESPKPNNTGLPNQLKAGIESLSGMSMDHVKVHYNSDKPAQLQAHAYAQGSDIHVAPGQEQHLPHEAWHVVQQAQGRVKPTMQMKGDVPINDDAGLEAEADVMGAKALNIPQMLQFKSAGALGRANVFSPMKMGATSLNVVNKELAIQRVHIGYEPDVPNNYRVRTTCTGSTPAHYGGGRMGIHTGVYNNNAIGGFGGAVLAAPVNAMSDHSGNGLVDRNWATNNEPQIDHIVPVAEYGSNSYSNARVLSTQENTGGVAVNRPGAANIVTRAHQNVRIQAPAVGHDSTTPMGATLGAAENALITHFGGIATAIGAASGTVNNGVQIDEW